LGISATLIPYLFEEFIRDERVKKEIRGTGLGLYIARKITEAHGGKLWAESPGEGKGSTFRVQIPAP
jgi:signal transduction histidine kinase